jgi:hypothetical protein
MICVSLFCHITIINENSVLNCISHEPYRQRTEHKRITLLLTANGVTLTTLLTANGVTLTALLTANGVTLTDSLAQVNTKRMTFSLPGDPTVSAHKMFSEPP